MKGNIYLVYILCLVLCTISPDSSGSFLCYYCHLSADGEKVKEFK